MFLSSDNCLELKTFTLACVAKFVRINELRGASDNMYKDTETLDAECHGNDLVVYSTDTIILIPAIADEGFFLHFLRPVTVNNFF